MSIYNYQVGNYVSYGFNGYARIEKINSLDSYNTYEITVLRSYPKDTEKKATVKENEIMPISLWGKGDKFLLALGYTYDKSSQTYRDVRNKIAIREIALDFPMKIQATLYGRIIIGLTRVFYYLIGNESKITAMTNEVLEKAKSVKSEDDLKAFVSKEARTSYVHDIQNFHSECGAEFVNSIETAILGF